MGRPHVGLEGGVGDLGDRAVPDPYFSEAGWRGKHHDMTLHDGVREHLGGPYFGLVDGDTNEVKLLLGELGFGWVEDDTVCCASDHEVTGTVVLFEGAWLGDLLDLSLDLVLSWDWGRSVACYCCRGDGEGERLADGEGLSGVHDSRPCGGGHTLIICVGGVKEVYGRCWSYGRLREGGMS